MLAPDNATMQTINELKALAHLPSNTGDTLNLTSPKQSFRAIFISDVHLGTKDCKASELSDFLKHNTCDTLYLVGDIFDGWKMKSGIFWPKSFNRFVRRLLKIAKQGTTIYYITGNHDEFLRKYSNTSFDNIHIRNRCTHLTASNKKLLVIHGDQFEGVTRCTALLRHIGDNGYELLMFLNRNFNRIRARYGLGYWSFAGYLKSHIKRAKQYITDYELAVTHGAKKQGFDGVVCGHIHHAANKELEGVHYMNTGDWVESCTAIAEDHNGNFTLIHWLKDPRYQTLKANKAEKIAARRKKQQNLATGQVTKQAPSQVNGNTQSNATLHQ